MSAPCGQQATFTLVAQRAPHVATRPRRARGRWLGAPTQLRGGSSSGGEADLCPRAPGLLRDPARHRKGFRFCANGAEGKSWGCLSQAKALAQGPTGAGQGVVALCTWLKQGNSSAIKNVNTRRRLQHPGPAGEPHRPPPPPAGGAAAATPPSGHVTCERRGRGSASRAFRSRDGASPLHWCHVSKPARSHADQCLGRGARAGTESVASRAPIRPFPPPTPAWAGLAGSCVTWREAPTWLRQRTGGAKPCLSPRQLHGAWLEKARFLLAEAPEWVRRRGSVLGCAALPWDSACVAHPPPPPLSLGTGSNPAKPPRGTGRGGAALVAIWRVAKCQWFTAAAGRSGLQVRSSRPGDRCWMGKWAAAVVTSSRTAKVWKPGLVFNGRAGPVRRWGQAQVLPA